jgi:hypothetical protein
MTARLTDAQLDALASLLEDADPGRLTIDLDCFEIEEPEIEACIADEGIRVLLTAGTGFFNRDVPEAERMEQWRLAEESRAYKIVRLLGAASNTLPALLAEVREARRIDHELLGAAKDFYALVDGESPALLDSKEAERLLAAIVAVERKRQEPK